MKKIKVNLHDYQFSVGRISSNILLLYSIYHQSHKTPEYTQTLIKEKMKQFGGPKIWCAIHNDRQTQGRNLLESAGFREVCSTNNSVHSGRSKIHLMVKISRKSSKPKKIVLKCKSQENMSKEYYKYMHSQYGPRGDTYYELKKNQVKTTGFPSCCGARLIILFMGGRDYRSIKESVKTNSLVNGKILVAYTKPRQKLLEKALKENGFSNTRPVKGHKLWWKANKYVP